VQRGDNLSGVRVAVLGAGATGLLAIAAAQELDASAVACIARHDHQADLARRFGADLVLQDRDSESAAVLKEFGPDIIVECVGGKADTLALAVDVCAPRGEISVLGLFDTPQPIDARSAFRRELRMVFPVVYGAVGGRHDYDIAANMLAQPLPFSDLITHLIPLDEIERAYATAADKTAGAVRVVVVPDESEARRTRWPGSEGRE
jgi:threonine dehydrogenase-like Zn-dependent dehydrogenase